MELNSFLEQILTAVNAELPSGRTARYKSVNKLNGVVYTGMYLDSGVRGTVSPIVYMEPIFEGVASPEDIPAVAADLSRVLQQPVRNEDIACQVADFDFSAERIVFRLIRVADNEEALKNLPHRFFLDLAVTYSVFLSDGFGGIGIAQVTESMRKQWRTDEETLYRLAMRNSPRLLGESVRAVSEVLEPEQEAVPEQDRKRVEEAARCFVVSNQYAFFGTSTLIYSKEYARIAEEIRSDLVLIATSVHEIMTVPADFAAKIDLKMLQKAIMSEDPKPENSLTDHAYLFVRETGGIRSL